MSRFWQKKNCSIIFVRKSYNYTGVKVVHKHGQLIDLTEHNKIVNACINQTGHNICKYA